MIIIFIIILVLVFAFWKISQSEYAFYYQPLVKPVPKCNKKACLPGAIVYDTNGYEYKSLCDFHGAQCRNPKLKLANSAPEKCEDRKCTSYRGYVYDTTGKRYENDCLFRIAKCKNPKLELRLNNAPGKTTPGKTTQAAPNCPECLPVAQVEKPTYDTDGNYYFNDYCGFNKAKCLNPKLEQYDCAKHNCSNKTIPVCDDKGKKYSNVCEFLKETCKGKIILSPCPD